MHPRRQISAQPVAPLGSLPADDQEWFPYIPFFAIYAIAAIYFYIAVVEPYLAAFDLFATRILADTITYETICVTGVYYLDWTTLRDIGPCTALSVTGFKSGQLSILNAFLIVISSIWLAKAYARRWKPVLALILINPITFISIFGANKEIFGLIAFIMLAIFIRNRSIAALAICLVTSLFTRLPVMIIVVAYWLILVTVLPRDKVLNGGDVRRYKFLIGAMAVVVSIIAVMFAEELQYNLLGDMSQIDDVNKALEITLSLEYLSGYGLYIINCIIRTLMNLYSGVAGFQVLLSGGVADYYSVGVAGSSFIFVVLTAFIMMGRRADDLSGNATFWNIVTFVALFSLILCISPVIQHRYFYPLYVFLILFVTRQCHPTTASARQAAFGTFPTMPMPSERRAER